MRQIIWGVVFVSACVFGADTFTTADYHRKFPTGYVKQAREQGAYFETYLENDGTLPATLDYRTLNAVTPVKNQGSTGDCWAFSATAALESQVLLHDQKSVSLSEQFLNDCNPFGYNGSVGGDFPILGFQVKTGQPFNKDYPWAERNQRCKQGAAIAYKGADWGYVGDANQSPTVDQIRAALVLHGPLSIDVAVGNGFQSYRSGVLNREDGAPINHMILLVGYDHAKKYWIAKNSWGTGWGEAGYLRIRYGIDKVAETTAFIAYP